MNWFRRKKMSEEEKQETPAEATTPADAATANAPADAGKTDDAARADAAGENATAGENAETVKADATESQAESEKPAEPPKPAEPDWKTLYALTLADFDNYKKRAARDREDVYRYAEADILKDILPTVDNLALALANAKPKAGAEDAAEKSVEDPFVKGVQLVYDTLVNALKNHGAEPFDSVGQELDTEKMEAITMMPSADVAEGKVVAEVKRGWLLKGKTLRAAQVVVSSGAPETK